MSIMVQPKALLIREMQTEALTTGEQPEALVGGGEPIAWMVGKVQLKSWLVVKAWLVGMIRYLGV